MRKRYTNGWRQGKRENKATSRKGGYFANPCQRKCIDRRIERWVCHSYIQAYMNTACTNTGRREKAGASQQIHGHTSTHTFSLD